MRTEMDDELALSLDTCEIDRWRDLFNFEGENESGCC